MLHDELSVRLFLADKNIAELEQPLYSTDLAPYDLILFTQAQGDPQMNTF